MHVRVRSSALRIPPLLSNQARHRCLTVSRRLAPIDPLRSPAIVATHAIIPNQRARRVPPAESGSHSRVQRHHCAMHGAEPSPQFDTTPATTSRPDWTSASYPCGLASEVVIPPPRGHRQPYAEARKPPENTQRRGTHAPRRCHSSQGIGRISGRNRPRASRG
jgi:hypothetical protein